MTNGGTVAEYGREHFMVASPVGRAVLYDLTLPIPWNEDAMPATVIAADLATSLNTRERSGVGGFGSWHLVDPPAS